MREYFSKPGGLKGFTPLFQKRAGFTLIEILVTAGLIVYITSTVIRNFTTSRLNLERVANVMASDIRLAQQLALSSKQFQGPTDPAPRNRCGYGITQDPNNLQQGYIIYTGRATLDPNGNSQNCNARNYQTSQDTPTYKTIILDSRVNFRDNPGNAFKDMFFEPPGPTAYFNNSSTPANPSNPADYYNQIVIKKVGVNLQGGQPGTSCSTGHPDCIFICAYLSGRVEVTKSSTCPVPF